MHPLWAREMARPANAKTAFSLKMLGEKMTNQQFKFGGSELGMTANRVPRE